MNCGSCVSAMLALSLVPGAWAIGSTLSPCDGRVPWPTRSVWERWLTSPSVESHPFMAQPTTQPRNRRTRAKSTAVVVLIVSPPVSLRAHRSSRPLCQPPGADIHARGKTDTPAFLGFASLAEHGEPWVNGGSTSLALVREAYRALPWLPTTLCSPLAGNRLQPTTARHIPGAAFVVLRRLDIGGPRALRVGRLGSMRHVDHAQGMLEPPWMGQDERSVELTRDAASCCVCVSAAVSRSNTLINDGISTRPPPIMSTTRDYSNTEVLVLT